MDEWLTELRQGSLDAAWDRFIERYRRLILSAIRHYTRDPDEVMDVFARVCEALREGELRRLRRWADEPSHRARFSTWLVTVVRHLTVDWFRHRDGRRRLARFAGELSPLRRRIFELVFVARASHADAYERLCAADPPGPGFREYLTELRETYRAVLNGRRGRLIHELLPAPTPDVDVEPVEAADRREWLDRVLATLEPADRVALELYVVDELPAAEIARILGLSGAKAVYNRVYRALAGLRARLGAAGIGRKDL